ncbi:hypothetical protein BDR26DRAFT_866484 [Obelidium mucronatum]|nr:hypothetical protein BDR26DRAFT_866484 [Obelidium mucronatum]
MDLNNINSKKTMHEIQVPESGRSERLETSLSRSVNEFAVLLNGNQSTGYCWELADTPLSLGVRPVSNEYVSHQDRQMDGSGGIHRFVFRISDSSLKEFSLAFAYKRSWEPEPIKTQTVCVTIE